MSNMELRFGALCKPLSEQLKGKVCLLSGKKFDALSNAFYRLRIHGLFTDREAEKIMQRFLKLIKGEVKRHSQLKEAADRILAKEVAK